MPTPALPQGNLPSLRVTTSGRLACGHGIIRKECNDDCGHQDRHEDRYGYRYGYDASGTVERVGEEVTLFRPGDEVFYAGDITRPGSNATLQLVDERIVGHRPRRLDATDAAALPLTGLTAWEALFDKLRLTRESTGTLLVVGAAGGVDPCSSSSPHGSRA